MSELIESELAEIASKIKGHNQRMRAVSKMALTTARQTGDLLVKAKSMLRHGEFRNWVVANCDISIRYAQVAMQISTNWEAIDEFQKRSYCAFQSVDDAVQYIRDQKSDDTKTRMDARLPAEPEQAEPASRVRSHCGPSENPTKTSELAKVAEVSERIDEADPIDEIMALIAKLNTTERDKLMERLDPPYQSDPELHAVMGETARRLSLADPLVKSKIDEALESEDFGDYPGIAVRWILDALDGDCVPEDIGLLVGEARIRFAIETLSSDAVVALGYLALGAVEPNLDLSGVIDCTALEEIFGQSELSEE